MQSFIRPLIRRGCGNTGMLGKVGAMQSTPKREKFREGSGLEAGYSRIPKKKLPDP